MIIIFIYLYFQVILLISYYLYTLNKYRQVIISVRYIQRIFQYLIFFYKMYENQKRIVDL